MIDASMHSLKENVKITNSVLKVANEFGVSVEAELGRLKRLDENNFTDTPIDKIGLEDVKQYLSLCNPDMLALGIGNAHGFYKTEPNIYLEILDEAKDISSIPLVLNWCIGSENTIIKKAIKKGVAKINFGT